MMPGSVSSSVSQKFSMRFTAYQSWRSWRDVSESESGVASAASWSDGSGGSAGEASTTGRPDRTSTPGNRRCASRSSAPFRSASTPSRSKPTRIDMRQHQSYS